MTTRRALHDDKANPGATEAPEERSQPRRRKAGNAKKQHNAIRISTDKKFTPTATGHREEENPCPQLVLKKRSTHQQSVLRANAGDKAPDGIPRNTLHATAVERRSIIFPWPTQRTYV